MRRSPPSSPPTAPRPDGPRRSLPTGIVRTPKGYRAFVRVKGELKTRRWKRDETTLEQMKAWREEQRVRQRLGAELPPPTGHGQGLRADVRAYLAQRKTMPTLQDRTHDLEQWIAVFGPDRDRQTITVGEVIAQLEQWRADGYAANTVNHRRTALMHLFTRLDGKAARNPLRDVPRYPDDSLDAPPPALSNPAAALILDAMPESLTKRRLELFAWTGWPPAQIKKLTPKDIRWREAVRLQPRRKGKGAQGVWLPLLPQAWAAIEAFKKAGAWGSYSNGSVRKSFRLAASHVIERVMLPLAIRAELEDVTPYQLRHTFLSLVAGIAKDDRAVQTLGQHSNIKTTHRYTENTADPRAVAALHKVTNELPFPMSATKT